MEHWNKGGISQEEFLRMREEAMRRLQDLAKRQAPRPEKSPVAAQVGGTKPPSPKQEAPSVPQAAKTADALPGHKEAENLSAVPSVEKSEGETSPLQQERSRPFPEDRDDWNQSPAEPASEPDQRPAEMGDNSSVSHSAPSMEPREKPSDDFMPSENLLQTIQDISQTMAHTEIPLTDLPAADKKAEIPGPRHSEPAPKRPISVEPPFIPPHPPYHPDGFVPEKPGRNPTFHPDAVRPEKGSYLPPRPPQRPPYRQERSQKDGNIKKK